MQCSAYVGSASESLPMVRKTERILKPHCQAKGWDRPGTVAIPGRTFAESLQVIAGTYDFAVFICTGELEVCGRDRTIKVPRLNLLFEIGTFVHAIGTERILILLDGAVELPTDLDGLTYIRFDAGKRQSLEDALKQVIVRIKALGRRAQSLEGKRLYRHAGYYPIVLDADRKPHFDKGIYFKALRYLMGQRLDRLAALDLAWLWEANRPHSPVRFSAQEQAEYHLFLQCYDIEENIKRYEADHELIFKNIIRIVNDIGATLKDCGIELLFHDVRNPLRALRAAQNSEKISGRRKNDPSTGFVIEYLLHQGTGLTKPFDIDELVSYLKQLATGKTMKATTIPICDGHYGLVGFICINIDIGLIAKIAKSPALTKKFFEALTRNSDSTPKFEETNLAAVRSVAGDRQPADAPKLHRKRIEVTREKLAKVRSKLPSHYYPESETPTRSTRADRFLGAERAGPGRIPGRANDPVPTFCVMISDQYRFQLLTTGQQVAGHRIRRHEALRRRPRAQPAAGAHLPCRKGHRDSARVGRPRRARA